MDIHMHGNPCPYYGHNGYLQTPHSKDDGLQFLSIEEQECILFFEETIDSLGDGLEDDSTGVSSRESPPVEDIQITSSPTVNSNPNSAIAPSLIEHDIIDLVHFTQNMPDFQSLSATPQSHFEIKPKRDFPSTEDASKDGIHQPPPGSIPTPVIIASKIAEHQGKTDTSSLPSVLIQPRRSQESPHSPISRHGPPTHAKPHQLPDNISIIQGSQDPSPQSIATAAVNMQERRSQMLANLPPSANPLQGGEPACVRKPPSRSVSFKDPTPDKSRMEALSMLGLTQGRTVPATSTKIEISSATSANSNTNKVGSCADVASKSPHTYNTAVHDNTSPNSTVCHKNSMNNLTYSADTASNSSRTDIANTSPNTTISQKSSSSFTQSSPISYEPKAKSELFTSNFNNYGGKSAIIIPASTDKLDNHNKSSSAAPAQINAEVTKSDFNSYGGKTIMLNPTQSFKAESALSPGSSPVKPEPVEIQFNSLGSRSKVINPSMHSDLPDGTVYTYESNSHSPSSNIPTSHHNDLHNPTGGKSRIFPPTKAEVQHTRFYSSSQAKGEAQADVNSHEAKPKAVSPLHPDPVYQHLNRNRSGSAPPTPAPKPHWPTASLRPRPDPIPLEIRSRPLPKASFRTQGITVQFSGKGATDEARRDALRKLGLLKDTF